MISVIVPIYNVEKYLPQCVESLMNQTLKDIEIILVDDGSPDCCPVICDEYAEKDKRIKVIHQKNAGVSAARNEGLKNAQGAFIGFVDPDDWVAPEIYQSLLDAINETKADLAICGYAYCHENGTADEKRSYKPKPMEIATQKEVMKRMSDIPPSIRHGVCNKLFYKSLLQDISFPNDLHSSEDVWFLTQYIQRIHSAVIVHEPLYFNRVRDGSATHGGLSIHCLADSFKAHAFMYQSIIELYPDLKDYSQAFLMDVYYLKYTEAKRKAKTNSERTAADAADLKQMRKTIRREGIKAVFNAGIFWKTRIRYIIA